MAKTIALWSPSPRFLTGSRCKEVFIMMLCIWPITQTWSKYCITVPNLLPQGKTRPPRIVYVQRRLGSSCVVLLKDSLLQCSCVEFGWAVISLKKTVIFCRIHTIGISVLVASLNVFYFGNTDLSKLRP